MNRDDIFCMFSARSALPCINVNRKRAWIWERADLTTCPSFFQCLFQALKLLGLNVRSAIIPFDINHHRCMGNKKREGIRVKVNQVCVHFGLSKVVRSNLHCCPACYLHSNLNLISIAFKLSCLHWEIVVGLCICCCTFFFKLVPPHPLGGWSRVCNCISQSTLLTTVYLKPGSKTCFPVAFPLSCRTPRPCCLCEFSPFTSISTCLSLNKEQLCNF